MDSNAVQVVRAVGDSIGQIIDKITATLSPTAQYVVAAYVRQAWIGGIICMAVGVLLTVGSVLCWIGGLRLNRQPDDEGAGLAVIIFGGLGLLALAMVAYYNGLSGILNPQYAAIHNLAADFLHGGQH